MPSMLGGKLPKRTELHEPPRELSSLARANQDQPGLS